MVAQTFEKVWYLPDENRWRNMNIKAFRDVGRLIVGDNVLEFQGKKDTVIIKHVKRVSYGKQGRDFVNNWVKIEYGEDPELSTALFADGSKLGWGGIFGGTKRILAAVQHLVE
jgi:hypothetical protein